MASYSSTDRRGSAEPLTAAAFVERCADDSRASRDDSIDLLEGKEECESIDGRADGSISGVFEESDIRGGCTGPCPPAELPGSEFSSCVASESRDALGPSSDVRLAIRSEVSWSGVFTSELERGLSGPPAGVPDLDGVPVDGAGLPSSRAALSFLTMARASRSCSRSFFRLLVDAVRDRPIGGSVVVSLENIGWNRLWSALLPADADVGPLEFDRATLPPLEPPVGISSPSARMVSSLDSTPATAWESSEPHLDDCFDVGGLAIFFRPGDQVGSGDDTSVWRVDSQMLASTTIMLM